MSIRDPGFPGNVVGDHLASAGGGWEPQRAYNWVLQISGIGQSTISAVGSAIGGLIGGAVGAAVGGAIAQTAANITGAGAAGGNVIELALDSTTLPTVATEEIELNFLNTTRYVAGRAKYETMPLVLKDMVDAGVASAMKTWSEQVFDPRTHKVGLAKDYKKNGDLILFAPDGTLSRTWRLVGLWPMAVSYGQLDMNNSEKVMIEAQLRFDRALALNF